MAAQGHHQGGQGGGGLDQPHGAEIQVHLAQGPRHRGQRPQDKGQGRHPQHGPQGRLLVELRQQRRGGEGEQEHHPTHEQVDPKQAQNARAIQVLAVNDVLRHPGLAEDGHETGYHQHQGHETKGLRPQQAAEDRHL